MRFSLFVCSSLLIQLIHKQQLWLGEKYKMKQRATVEIVKTKFQCAFLRWSFFVAGFFFSLSTDVVYVFDCSFGIHDLLQSFSFVSFRIHNEKLLSCFPLLPALFLHIRTNCECFRCFVTLCLPQCVHFYLCLTSKTHTGKKLNSIEKLTNYHIYFPKQSDRIVSFFASFIQLTNAYII